MIRCTMIRWVVAVVAVWLSLCVDSRAQPISAAEMRPLGMIGGTSWHSTAQYYRYMNQEVNNLYGDNTNPPLILYNLNQREIHELQLKGHWDEIAHILSNAAAKLRAAGAQAIIFCANTPYNLYSEVSRESAIPILHIADAVGLAVKKAGLTKVGLIGTKYTMEGGFYADWLQKHYGIEVIVPTSESSRANLQRIIQKELVMGVFKSGSKQYILEQIKDLQERGAQGIILGCTEFPLIIHQSDLSIPAFDTTRLHAEMAVDFIMHRLEPRDPGKPGF
jgi:aspartate racemase